MTIDKCVHELILLHRLGPNGCVDRGSHALIRAVVATETKRCALTAISYADAHGTWNFSTILEGFWSACGREIADEILHTGGLEDDAEAAGGTDASD